MAKKKPPIGTQAKNMANAALHPELAALNNERARTDSQYGASENALEAAYAALAEIQKGVAPATEGVYDRAEGATSAYAAGFSEAFKAASEGSAANLNEFLGKQGSPQTVEAAGQRGGDVLYGLGGYIPASQLNREGAAFTAAAERLPDTSAGLGVDALKGLDQRRLAALRDLGQQRLAIEAKRPALISQFRSQIEDSRRADAASLREDRSLDLQEQEFKFRKEEARRPSPQLFGSGETGYMTFDPKTGRVTRLTSPAPPGTSPPDLIGSADSGYYAWDAASGTVTPVLAPAQKPRFTPKELREVKKDAANMAYDAFWGIKDKNGEVTGQPMHYQEAMAWLLDQQVPLEVAQSALNRWWKKPGLAADKKSRLDGSPYFFKPKQKGVTGRPLKPIQERQPQGSNEWKEWVGTPERRRGPSKPHSRAILRFVGEIGMIAGRRLTPWGNESHSILTVNGNRSAHADGNAADIPASGDDLLRLGRTALIAAGMSPVQAAKAPGGLYNIGGYQIIFATNEGGNHFDHVHVGLRR